MSTPIKGTVWILLAMVLASPATLLASTLTVSGVPRLLNTLCSGYPCMNPAATGGAGSYRWDLASNPGNRFSIDATYGTVSSVGALAAEHYPITVRVTDANNATATEDVVVSVVSTGLVVVGTDTIFDNYAGSAWFSNVGIFANGFANSASGSTWTITDPAGHFAVVQGYNVMTLTKGTPPAGDYAISIILTQNGNNLGPFSFTMHVVPSQKITNITFAQNTVSTSQSAGIVVGTASAIVWEPGYQWSISYAGGDNGTFTILDPNTGVVTLTKTPTLGNRNITIQVKDGLNTYSQNFTVNVVAGTAVSPGNMSLTVASGLDNYTSSGVLSTPTITGITGTKSWSFTGDGAGNRYAINASTGQITIVRPLSYNPTIDGVDYSDVIALTCTDGINTCTNSFRIPVAACVGPVLNVGPGQTYAHLDDALGYCANQGWGRPFAGVTFNVYPSSDPNYYLNDGQTGPIKGVFPVPVTIQGAPGQTFPKFRGGSLYYGKGFFMSYNYDLWVKNVEISNVTDGSNGSGNDNLTGVCKEAGCSTGNVFVDNFYIHDCQDGIARGSHGMKWFITNGRVSHCGVGQAGYTHNIYLLGDFAYVRNVLTDQSSVGHTFKSRCVRNIIKDCRMFDGELGHGSIVLDLPEGGVGTVTNTVIQKGPNYQNPWALHFADAGDNWSSHAANQLTVSGCSFFADVWLPGNVIAMLDVSLAAIDGTPASMTASGNSFFGFQAANYLRAWPNPGGATGAASISGSTALTAQPPLDWSFPGPGPDPTIASPPGPFLAPYGVIGGAQITLPVNEIRVDFASPVGTSVVNPTWLPGNSGATSATWSLRKNPGNRYAINPSTGAITTAAALVPGTVDVLEINVSQPPIQFYQNFPRGFYDYPADGSFIHSIYVVVSGNLPPTYIIAASAGTGGTISPSGEVAVNSGALQTFTIAANPGYVIASVAVDGVSAGAVSTYTFSNVTTSHTIAASFNLTPSFTIAASAGTGGTISPSGTVTVNASTSQRFTIAAYTGHTIADVIVDGSSVGAVDTYTFSSVTANHTIAATFNVVGSGGVPVLVDFETAGQESLFANTGMTSWARVAGHGGYLGRMTTGNAPAWLMYKPGGVSYPVGVDMIKVDVNLNYAGHPGATAEVGLVLQQKSISEQYEAHFQAYNGQIKMIVGNLDYWGGTASGHSASVSSVVGTFTEGTTPLDLGWYKITAAVTAINGDQYQVTVTVTRPDSTTATLTYVDTGSARYSTACPAGFRAMSQWGAAVNVDNFQIITYPVSPSAPQLGLVTGTTVQLLSLGSENDATTAYPVQETATGQYVGQNGRLQAAPFWQARQAWAGAVVWGLSATTTYQFRSKARNSVGVESSYGPAASVTTTITGDTDGDGHVDVSDLLYLADSWAKSTGEAGFNPACDFNGDGSVDAVDLLMLADNWGT